VLYCSGSICVGVMVWFGWGGVVSLCRLRHCLSLQRLIHNKSQAPEDGCINIRNMLSSKYQNNKASDIKLICSLFNMFQMLVHSSSGACDLLWIYFVCCIALVRCVLVLQCGILMQAEALVLQPA